MLGLTAEDRAVGGHLEWLSKNGISTGPHFWLTDRQDQDTDSWAEQSGIRIIRYSNKNNDHAEVDEFFKALISFIPKDEVDDLKPVVSASYLYESPTDLPPPDDLILKDTETIRLLLNKKANQILSPGTDESFENYEDFCATYDEAIHRAWYVSTANNKNYLLGYKIESLIARGAFGQVYKATTKNGTTVAIKVLLEEIRNNGDLLRSFRRGIRSMRITENHQLDGIVRYIDATEIPAVAVMEWIDGPNLYDAIMSRQISDWSDILRIGRDLAGIIKAAHALPERVLHRDLRPENIMLKNFYVDPDNWGIVVLDFDLSWHRGAVERSVMHSTAVGYLAPEQIQRMPGVSTRNSSVDSFGFGMSMYFSCTSKPPLPDQHKHVGWIDQLCTQITKGRRCESWKSTPKRMARLIEYCTLDEQSRRWDMSQIESELTALLDAVQNPLKVVSAELATEEIANHSNLMEGYMWNLDESSASITLPSGTSIQLQADEIGKAINLKLSWGRTGLEERKGIGKTISAAMNKSIERLRSGGWIVVRPEIKVSEFSIDAKCDIQDALPKIKKLGSTIDSACDHLRIGS
ncbi:MAG: protein kinase [Burkholderiales bacterium]|jgi:serine/threonine protein kinase|nr:protein kinase [Burkholderiales bacterium]